MQRIPTHRLPNHEISCPELSCVYNKDAQCDMPRTNKGNSDATCHGWPNKRLLDRLGVPVPADYVPNPTA